MYIKHIVKHILLDFTYFTFKLLENNEYGLNVSSISAKLKCVNPVQIVDAVSKRTEHP